MRYEIFLALRNLRVRRKKRLTRVTALVAVMGIAIGVAALIVALSLANGFRDEMRAKILQGTAHVNVMHSDGQPIEDYRKVVARIRQIDQVADAAGTTYDGAVVIGPKSTAYAVLRGVDPDSQQAKAELDRFIVDGSARQLFETQGSDLRGVVIGAELASRAGLRVGDVAEIVSASGDLQTARPIRKPTRVVGIFRSGLFEYDSTWIYLSLDLATAMGGARDQVRVISVQVKDIYKVKSVDAELRSELGDSYTTIDWQEANRPLFAALTLERRMGLLIIALIIFIAALNITTTLVLVVVERRRDIAILSTMGATRRSIMSIFVMEGAMIGSVGAVLGVLMGIVACYVGNRYRLVSLPADVYSISHVPFNLGVVDVLTAGLVALLLSLVATIYPARAAARVRPVEMLRDAG